jgi:hypothetical protein
MTAYLIWSNEHRAWWGPNNAGYTVDINRAGRYSRDAAIDTCAKARDGFTAHDVPTEIPVREDDAADCVMIDKARKP